MKPPVATDTSLPGVGRRRENSPGDLRPGAARDLRAKAARDDMAERRRITQKLRAALAQGGFVLHYQPKIHLKSGRVRGVEAMIRMQHRRRGLILPAQFMPVAERSDIIHDIGAWMLTQACEDAARWPERLSVSLNVSPRQLRSPNLIKQLIEALAHAGLTASRLELELSEAMLIDDNEDTNFNLRAVRGLGIGVALDDFGAGYASLTVLRRLPLTTLKLDRSVLLNLQTGETEAAILRATIDAAHALGCTVVADGVETESQCRILDQLGCDEAQGNFFSPALRAPDILSRLGY